MFRGITEKVLAHTARGHCVCDTASRVSRLPSHQRWTSQFNKRPMDSRIMANQIHGTENCISLDAFAVPPSSFLFCFCLLLLFVSFSIKEEPEIRNILCESFLLLSGKVTFCCRFL